MIDRSRLSIGLPGATPPAVLDAFAPQIEAAGFRGLWLNDTPDGDSLVGLAAAARATSTLRLATGVIPLDRRPAASIQLDDLPADRLTLGVGIGQAPRGLSLIESSIPQLRATTTAELAVGALGPRMRALAARTADAVLVSWLTPEIAAAQRAELAPARCVLYVRTALSPDALPALEAEAARYGGYPSYAANFERIGAEPLETTIRDVDRIPVYLDAADEVVLRVITREPSLVEYERFLATLA